MMDLQLEQRNRPAFGVFNFLPQDGQAKMRGNFEALCAALGEAAGLGAVDVAAPEEGAVFRCMVSEAGIPDEPPL